MFGMQACVYIVLVFGLPVAFLVACSRVVQPGGLFALPIIVAGVPVAAFLYAVIAGVLSLSHQRYVRPGVFPTSLTHRLYRHRRLYGLCWTLVYYSGPVYAAILSLPVMRRLVLKLFGMRGTIRFSCYPDTWLRDLPLLKIDEGAYVSNRVTLGTNMILRGGHIVVNGISIGAGTLVGHGSILGPGVRIGRDSELGVDTLVSVGVLIGDRTRIGAGCAIGTGAIIDDDVVIEHRVVVEQGARVRRGAQVGTRAFIPSGVTVPAGAVVLPGAQFASEDCDLTAPVAALGAAG